VYWPPFEFNGQKYDLCHLQPKTVTFLQPANATNMPRTYKVEVIFSLHCFTRGMQGSEHIDHALCYSDRRETRIFDFRRYEFSRHLPGIVSRLMTCKCFQTARDNFFTAELLDENGNKVSYEIYFTASKASREGIINLYIQSAYVRDRAHSANRPPPMKAIPFAIILYNTLHKPPLRRS
jgi:hypothetical protein